MDIVVAGGRNEDSVALSSVEIFNTFTGQWREGPELPRAIYGASYHQVGDSFIVVGGLSDGALSGSVSNSFCQYYLSYFFSVKLQVLAYENNTWVDVGQNLEFARRYHAGLFVQDHAVGCI